MIVQALTSGTMRVSRNRDQGRPIGQFYRRGQAPAWTYAALRNAGYTGEVVKAARNSREGWR